MVGILLDADLDVLVKVKRGIDGKIKSGLVIADTNYQNQGLILQAHKGEIKEYPLLGVGISDIVLDSDLLGWKREIAEQFEYDGLEITSMKVDKDLNISINAKYHETDR